MDIFKTLFHSPSEVVINGVSYVGQNVSIVRGKVIVDGVEQDELKSYHVSVQVNGNPSEVSTVSGRVTVSGSVGGDVTTTSGDICCGDVGGSVKTTSGDVECAQIAGSVRTVSGDISHT